MTKRLSRRAFSQAGAVTLFGLTALEASRVLVANERVRLGFIGIGSRRVQVAAAFAQHTDADIAALCDVCCCMLENANEKLAQGKAAAYGDFRKLLDRKDLDAVVIATPDHWHAIQTFMACRAGMEPIDRQLPEGYAQHMRDHTRDFLDGLKSRERPRADAKSATAPPPQPSWPTSPWRPSRRSPGIPRASRLPTSRKPTSSCTTNTASPGCWSESGAHVVRMDACRSFMPAFRRVLRPVVQPASCRPVPQATRFV